MTAIAMDEVRLHVETGQLGRWIWFARRNVVTAYPLDPISFVSQEWVKDTSLVRLLGTADNAPLIVALYRTQRLCGKPARVQLGSPLVCGAGDGRLSAATIFRHMDQLDYLAPSLGGWHDLTNKDYTSYALADAIYAAKGKFTGAAEKFMEGHPAWPALSFLPTFNKVRGGLLLALLLDPRWYVDPENCNRAARLRSHFGMTADKRTVRLIQMIMEGRADAAPKEDVQRISMLQVALDTWAGEDLSPTFPLLAGEPANFLWRIAQDNAHGPQGLALGLRRATSVFLRFVCEVWTDAVSVAPCYDPLFHAGYFFQDQAVVAAWRHHLCHLRFI